MAAIFLQIVCGLVFMLPAVGSKFILFGNRFSPLMNTSYPVSIQIHVIVQWMLGIRMHYSHKPRGYGSTMHFAKKATMCWPTVFACCSILL